MRRNVKTNFARGEKTEESRSSRPQKTPKYSDEKKKDLKDQIEQTDTENLDVILTTLSYALKIVAKTKIRDKDRILICIINFAHN